jgi:hypothetical protein
MAGDPAGEAVAVEAGVTDPEATADAVKGQRPLGTVDVHVHDTPVPG